MNFEQWAKGHSTLHVASVQIKIIGAVCFSFTLASCQQLPAVMVGLLISFAMVLLAKIPLRALFKRLMLVNIFILICWVTLPVTIAGTPMAHVGFIAISREGVDLATLLTLKTNGMVLFFVAFLSTSSVADLGHGLRRLKMPQKFCLLLLFSYRYIFVIYEEYTRLKRAATFRSFKPTSSMHTYQTYGNLFGMTLVKGWKRAGRVQDAMALRGFTGEFVSLNYAPVRLSDWLLLAGVIGCSGIVIFFEYVV